LERGGTGHPEIVAIYDELQDNYGFTEESVVSIASEAVSKPIFQDGDVVGRKPENTIEIGIEPDKMGAELQITEHKDTSFRLVDRVDSEIEAGEQRFRQIGLGLLILGFILQMPQYIL
jgi:hypothetical protein